MSAYTKYDSKMNEKKRADKAEWIKDLPAVKKDKYKQPRYTTDPNPSRGELGFKFVGYPKGEI